eukprot:CAMPEP_0194365184 /NCGR_PEP_ID=MMETSP0174-20130528/13181_1 /TAXON_ID=216777 /ORGANISM="Proboscia alata, Strain PI-D3" /LENGTH=1805 /DNA_ID=CAMNT_0039139697 /DNA_START=381 /DNA_END=5798 /DNA_ORIENTATION=-
MPIANNVDANTTSQFYTNNLVSNFQNNNISSGNGNVIGPNQISPKGSSKIGGINYHFNIASDSPLTLSAVTPSSSFGCDSINNFHLGGLALRKESCESSQCSEDFLYNPEEYGSFLNERGGKGSHENGINEKYNCFDPILTPKLVTDDDKDDNDLDIELCLDEGDNINNCNNSASFCTFPRHRRIISASSSSSAAATPVPGGLIPPHLFPTDKSNKTTIDQAAHRHRCGNYNACSSSSSSSSPGGDANQLYRRTPGASGSSKFLPTKINRRSVGAPVITDALSQAEERETNLMTQSRVNQCPPLAYGLSLASPLCRQVKNSVTKVCKPSPHTVQLTRSLDNLLYDEEREGMKGNAAFSANIGLGDDDDDNMFLVFPERPVNNNENGRDFLSKKKHSTFHKNPGLSDIQQHFKQHTTATTLPSQSVLPLPRDDNNTFAHIPHVSSNFTPSQHFSSGDNVSRSRNSSKAEHSASQTLVGSGLLSNVEAIHANPVIHGTTKPKSSSSSRLLNSIAQLPMHQKYDFPSGSAFNNVHPDGKYSYHQDGSNQISFKATSFAHQDLDSDGTQLTNTHKEGHEQELSTSINHGGCQPQEKSRLPQYFQIDGGAEIVRAGANFTEHVHVPTKLNTEFSGKYILRSTSNLAYHDPKNVDKGHVIKQLYGTVCEQADKNKLPEIGNTQHQQTGGTAAIRNPVENYPPPVLQADLPDNIDSSNNGSIRYPQQHIPYNSFWDAPLQMHQHNPSFINNMLGTPAKSETTENNFQQVSGHNHLLQHQLDPSHPNSLTRPLPSWSTHLPMAPRCNDASIYELKTVPTELEWQTYSHLEHNEQINEQNRLMHIDGQESISPHERPANVQQRHSSQLKAESSRQPLNQMSKALICVPRQNSFDLHAHHDHVKVEARNEEYLMTNSPIQHSSIPRAAPQRKGGIFRSMGKVENSCAKPHMDPSVSGPKRRQQPNGKSRRRRNSQQQDLKHVRRKSKNESNVRNQSNQTNNVKRNTALPDNKSCSSNTGNGHNKQGTSPLNSSKTKQASVIPKKKKHSLKQLSSPSSKPLKTQKSKQKQVINIDDSHADAEQKRAELVESPTTRLAYKDFFRKFRAKERLSFSLAEEYAMKCLENNLLPEKVQWKVFLEMADLAKRANRVEDARRLYRKVCRLQPYANSGWLEYSKLEEECGDLDKCALILRRGLVFCEYNESLLTRAIKHEETMGRLHYAREILARLKHVGIEKVWRTVLEGALLEARAGNVIISRRVLKYLMLHVPWYGPLYLEAYRLERDACRNSDALLIVERGLAEIPRYGPLWFAGLRLCEGLDVSNGDYHLPLTLQMVERASSCISRELLWKLHLEAAQIQERASFLTSSNTSVIIMQNHLQSCRRSFVRAILSCPPNLCWKVWLASGRMELTAGRTSIARKLFMRAYNVVPDKGRSTVLLECARLEEFVDDVKLARAILCKARNDNDSDWKIWLESVSLELRCGRRRKAVELAQNALDIHSCTGRLWALLVQIRHEDGEVKQSDVLIRALSSVPKSGEVWCEAGRLHLNPFVPTFDLDRAELYLMFATKFTPQYGDSFLETVKLELLKSLLLPLTAPFVEQVKKMLDSNELCDDGRLVNFACEAALSFVNKDCPSCPGKEMFQLEIDSALHFERCFKIDTNRLDLCCANADPNYGHLWFHCRRLSTDTARHVMYRAKHLMTSEISRKAVATFYIAAYFRTLAIKTSLKTDLRVEKELNLSGEIESTLESRLRDAISIEKVLHATSNSDCNQKSSDGESVLCGIDFVNGILDLNKYKTLTSLSHVERREVVFGSDSLLS